MSQKQSEKEWLQAVPEADRRAYMKSGFGEPLAIGSNPALIVIDVTLAFTGSKPQPLEDAIQECFTACGQMAWDTLPRIKELIDIFRQQKRPVIFTRSDVRGQQFAGGATKGVRPLNPDPKFSTFPDVIAPQEDEWILEKTKASIFFGTALNESLRRQKIDTLVICGVSTSGCVRASVVDGFSLGYNIFVVDDCCFDRSHYAHCANLFDMDAKYATVLSEAEIARDLTQIKAVQKAG